MSNHIKASPVNQINLPFDSLSTGKEQGKLYQNKDWLYNNYIKNKLTLKELGDSFNISDETIRYWLKKYGIKRRNAGESISAHVKREPKPYMIKKALNQKYTIEKTSTTEIANYYNCCSGTIWKWLKKHNIPIRTQSEWMKEYYKTHPNPMLGRCGKDHPNYGKHLSEEAKEKIRIKAMGRKVSEETKEKQRQKMLGKNNPYYGKKHSRKIRKKMKKGWKNMWNDEKRRKQFQNNSSVAHKGIPPPIKGKTYEEAYGIEKATKIKKQMSENLKGKFTMEKNPAWLGGKSFEPYGIEFNDKLKYQIRERDDFKCQYCGVKENSRAHDCHHIDSDKTNNNPQNLISLCVNCHSATKGNEINQKYWQGYFENMMNKKEYSLDF